MCIPLHRNTPSPEELELAARLSAELVELRRLTPARGLFRAAEADLAPEHAPVGQAA